MNSRSNTDAIADMAGAAFWTALLIIMMML